MGNAIQLPVTIALLALVYSDTTTNTTAEHIMNTWGSQKVVEFISHVSGGCTTLCFEPFVVEVPAGLYAAGGDGYARGERGHVRLVPGGGHRPLASSSARPTGRLL